MISCISGVENESRAMVLRVRVGLVYPLLTFSFVKFVLNFYAFSPQLYLISCHRERTEEGTLNKKSHLRGFINHPTH